MNIFLEGWFQRIPGYLRNLRKLLLPHLRTGKDRRLETSVFKFIIWEKIFNLSTRGLTPSAYKAVAATSPCVLPSSETRSNNSDVLGSATTRLAGVE